MSRGRSFLGMHVTAFAVVVGVAAVADAEVLPLRRVRSNDPAIAAVIVEATGRSTVFRRLITKIDTTDGLVYVDEGKCGHSVSACLMLSVKVAGPYRVLRILVDTTKYPSACRLMAAIGHELQHAVELLSESTVTDYRTAYQLFDHEGPTASGRFETAAARKAGLEVDAEACVRTTVPQLRSQRSP